MRNSVHSERIQARIKQPLRWSLSRARDILYGMNESLARGFLGWGRKSEGMKSKILAVSL